MIINEMSKKDKIHSQISPRDASPRRRDKEKATAINTPLGYFENYRDSIIIEKIEWNVPDITFFCNINGEHVSNKNDKEYIKFKIIFKYVISLFQAEYDTYEAIIKGFPKSNENISNFEIIENSHYIKNLPIRKDVKNVNHYCLSTYDDIFNIIATEYIFELS
jgi:hypothetical protein